MHIENKTVEEIASVHLGKKGGEGYKDQYDPSLLVRIPRKLNRQAHGIDDNNLPFVGYDVWNAYEVSAITTKGQPVMGMLKIVVPANSTYHVESKSLKLYLNSFNMTRLGDTAEVCRTIITGTVEKDLSELLGCEVQASFFYEGDFTRAFGLAYPYSLSYPLIDRYISLDDIDFIASTPSPLLLEREELLPRKEIMVSVDFLRSNCRVTFQPDWGSLVLYMRKSKEEEKGLPSYASLAKYIASYRTAAHFHEEICELIYKDLNDVFSPKELMVVCLYARRGGIDINPIRVKNADFIPSSFIDPKVRMEKMLKQ